MESNKVCPCCGLPIKDKFHKLDSGPYEYLCDKCWHDQILFKPSIDGVGHVLRVFNRLQISKNRKNRGDIGLMVSINIPVLRLRQKGITMYVGKINIREIMGKYSAEELTMDLKGYQRRLHKERIKNEIAPYIKDCPIAIMPAILVSLRSYNFIPLNGDLGILKIPKDSTIFVIDGQHRVAAFRHVYESLDELDPYLKNYELPVVFIDIKSAVKKVKMLGTNIDEGELLAITEGTFFFIVNKTAKPINPSHKDVLAYRTLAAKIRGIPPIEREEWRTEAVSIVIELNTEPPLRDKINIAGWPGMKRPIWLNSFVSSLKPLLKENNKFRRLGKSEKTLYIKSYWKVIEHLFKDAFIRPKDYYILKTIGVYALNYLANDVFNWCKKDGIDVPSERDIRPYLEPLKHFDWGRKTSKIAAFGGIKGAKEAHKLLLGVLAYRGVKKAYEKLEKMNLSKNEIEILVRMASEVEGDTNN